MRPLPCHLRAARDADGASDRITIRHLRTLHREIMCTYRAEHDAMELPELESGSCNIVTV